MPLYIYQKTVEDISPKTKKYWRLYATNIFELSFCRNRGGGGSGTAVDAVGVSGKDIRRYPVLMSDGSLIRKGPAVAGAVFGGHPAFALVLFGGAPGPSAIVGLLQQNVAGAQF